MEKLKYVICYTILVIGLTSCVGDLDVVPIDPALNTVDNTLKTEDDYFRLLAQCYAGFATSGSEGPDGSCHISGIDPGMSQYYRARYHLNGLTTDEAVCGWNDRTIADLHGLNWTTSDVFVTAFYYRILYQISICNEFIRRASNAEVELPEKEAWIAEARTLRALCWFDAIDNFGNVPFADETSPVGIKAPGAVTRTELFKYIEEELTDLIEGNNLKEPGRAEYGRADKGLAIMILAKLYLNAGVYTGREMYDECANTIKKLGSAYSLHPKYNELFLADNDKCTDEIIFAIEQDGNDTQSYGVTTYLIFASTGGTIDFRKMGISAGWGGIRTTEQFYRKFSDNDVRKLFHTDGQQVEVDDIADFSNGAAFIKFRNVCSDGTPGKSEGFADTDYPVFRYADALLMLAECEKRGVLGIGGLNALNKVRVRAGLDAVKDYTLEDILDERAREFYLEGWRRNDLVRFDKFTSGDYLWDWKGGVRNGRGVPSHMNIFPIPSKEHNPNITQNPGYTK